MRRRWLPLYLLVSVLAAGCPLRPNPLYHVDADDVSVPEDADPPIDADPEPPEDADHHQPDVIDHDDPVEADVDRDDGCTSGEILCDDTCVDVTDENNCGACGRVCDTEPACDCVGTEPECQYPGGRECFAACGPDDLMCGESCYAQPDDDHCGACSERCSTGNGCECRLTEDDETYDCMRWDGEAWVTQNC